MGMRPRLWRRPKARLVPLVVTPGPRRAAKEPSGKEPLEDEEIRGRIPPPLLPSREIRGSLNGDAEFQAVKDGLRGRLLKYTRRAFRMLPPLKRPRILDIGCGSGVPTMELARLSRGQVIGLDIDPSLLQVFQMKIGKAGFPDRVTALQGSLFDMDFPAESFDVIWSEGSIAGIGFLRGLREWRRFLRPGGFLVVHDEEGNIREKLGQIPASGYELLGSFVLGEKTWWREYYAPLERQIRKIRVALAGDSRVIALLDAEEREVEMVRHDPGRCRSVFFIMKKTS
jgi:ubiquinone/menaquinone biosynthesis C-methylase UbiE